MRFKPARNSLFGVLLRTHWWISLAIGAVLGLVAAALVPDGYRGAGLFAGAPFFVISVMAAWRARYQPSPAELARCTQALGAMGWAAFAKALEAAFQRDGYTVARRPGQACDFELERRGQRTLVAARRWKSAHCGLQPLQDLQAARVAADAPAALFIGLGTLSEPARALAAAEGITLWQAPELTRQLRGLLPQV